MINLLPKDQIKQLRASKHNVLLRRYAFLWLAAFLLIIGTIGYMKVALDNQTRVAADITSANEAKAKEFDVVEKEAKELRDNINQAKSILDQRVDYSNVLTKLGRVLPSNVSIVSISLDSQLFEGTKTLQLKAPDYQAIIETKKALEDSLLVKKQTVKIDDYSNIDDKNVRASISLDYDKKGFEL